MYPVSNAYKADMHRPTQRCGIKGTIGAVNFNSDNILSGTLGITNQCVDNDELILGAAYIGEFRATFRNINIQRYEWVGKEITPVHIRYIPNGLESIAEEVPLGVFTIAEATYSADGVAVVAYDNMSKLNKKASFDSTSGTAFGILTMICTSCGLNLGMTQAEVEALPNGTQLFGCYPDNDIETYRDMIAWLAQALACVVLVDRSGNIILKKYGMTAVDTIEPANRSISSTFSAYETRYSGISVVDIASKQTRYYGTDYDVYLTMNLGSNPFLQYGTKSTKETMMRAILDSIAAVAYVPYSISILGDPCYDLTDVLSQEGGLGDSEKAYCIQRYSWSLTGGYTAEGVGKNPDLANAKSKTDKEISGLLNDTSNNLIQYYFYTNADEISINDGNTRDIIYLWFASRKETHTIFQAEVLLNADADGTVGLVTYFVDSAEVVNYHPTETWIDGDHIMHLLYHIPISEAKLVRFKATLTASGGNITIPAGGVNAVVSGQGLVSSDSWDGYIDIEESIPRFRFTSMRLRGFDTSVTAAKQTPHRPTATANITGLRFTSMRLRRFDDTPFINKDSMSAHTHAELSAYTHEDLNNSFIHG